MNKTITMDYDEYLELENERKNYENKLDIIKQINNYDFLLNFIEEYTSKFQYKDIKVKEYGSNEWKNLSLPFNNLYEEAKKRIDERIKENIYSKGE